MTIIFEMLEASSRMHGEKNDCTVKAVAVATGIGYKQAHAHLASLGRKPQRGFVHDFDGTLWRSYRDVPKGSEGYITGMHRIGFKATEVKVYEGKTLGKVSRHLGKGNFIIRSNGHASAVVDGKLIDWASDTNRTRVKQVWRIEPIETPKVVPEKFRKLRHRKAKRDGLDPKTGLPLVA